MFTVKTCISMTVTNKEIHVSIKEFISLSQLKHYDHWA